MNARTLLFSTAIAGGLIAIAATTGDAPPERRVFEIYPIGTVVKEDGKFFLAIDEQYQDGLLGLDGWSHVQVIWWFDKNDTPQKRARLQVNPRGNKNNPLTGVFACRAPVRPNLVALTTCKVLSVENGRVAIDRIDAFPGTPIIDLKPYAHGLDSASDLRIPKWAGPPKNMKTKATD